MRKQGRLRDTRQRAREFLSSIGFSLSENKISIEGPDRLPWLRKGGRWGSFPVEKYLKPPEPGRHAVYGAEAAYQDGIDFSEQFRSSGEAFEKMYNTYSKPPLVPHIESVHRQHVRGVAFFNPGLILADTRDLTSRRSSDIGLILRSKLPRLLKARAALASHPVRGGMGREDATATVLENVPIELRSQVIPLLKKSIVRGPALRRAFLDTSPRNDQAIDLAYSLLHRNPKIGIAEASRIERLALETGGRSSKHLHQSVEMLEPRLGILRELVEQGISDKIF